MYGAGHPGVYGRPDWAGGQYQAPPMAHYPHGVTSGPPSAGLVSPVPLSSPSYSPHVNPYQGGISTVYSFVPIPGAQQHKRPRRRYEEIERMYKCGWNGCEKAYGTLNHLNAHVTMQSHGTKRTPEGMLITVVTTTTNLVSRIQRDKKRMEAKEEGGRSCPQS
jgi:hypothetical protein